ncbi:MAG: helix-turn-helix domain-containing protein, partial [Kiritimatiellae bacterium]|nr:helix-turn-helix domain-containing protein [Kiritimatiellia bacterium]
RLLLSTNAPIAAISRDCGFPNANHLRNIFASATGVSMREWRRRARQ